MNRAYGGRPKPYKERDEYFDASDEEEDVYSKPTRGGGQMINRGKNQTRGGRGGRNAALAMNEEDFPTL